MRALPSAGFYAKSVPVFGLFLFAFYLGRNVTHVTQSRYDTDQLIWIVSGIFFGWGACIWLIPASGFQETGALIPSGIALMAGLLLGPLMAAIRQPDSLFRVEHLLMTGLVYWVVFDAAQGAYDLGNVSREAVVNAFNGIALMAAAIWVGSLLVAPFQQRVAAREPLKLNARFIFFAAIACFFLGMLRVFIACRLSPGCVVSAFYAPRFANAWSTANIGNFDTILVRLQYFAYLVLPLTVALHHLEKRISWRVTGALVLGVLFLCILISTGGRRQVGMVMGASVLVWVLLNRPIKLRQLVFAGLFLLVILYVLQLMIAWRNVGFAKAFSSEPEYAQAIKTRGFLDIDKNLLFLARITDLVPEKYPHTGMQGVIFIVTAPIPRTLYPNKPVNRGFPLAYILNLRKGPGWTWTTTAVGDLYLIGGFLAIFIGGLLFGMLAGLCNRLLYPVTVRRALLFGMSAMTLFVGLRAVHDIVIASFAIFALWGITELQRWVAKPEFGQHETVG